MKIVDLLKFRNRKRPSASRRRSGTSSVPGTVESLEKRTLLSAANGIVDGTDNFDRIVISDNSSVDPTGETLLSSLVRISSFSDANFTNQIGTTTEFTTLVRGLTVNGGGNNDLIQIATDGILSDLTIDIEGGSEFDRVQIFGASGSSEANYSPDGSEPGAGVFNVISGPSIEFESVETLIASDFSTLNVITPEGEDEIFASRADNGLTQISGETNTSDLTLIQLFDVQSLVIDLSANDIDPEDDRFETTIDGFNNSGLNVVTILGGGGNDEFFVHPSNTTEINIDGGFLSDDIGGDRLIVEFAGVLNSRLPRNVTSGTVTSTSHQPINFEDIESVESTAVTLLSPTAGEVVDTARPTFSWTAAENATAYEIWVANLETGRRVLLETVTDTTWEANGDLGLGRHRFWVRSIINGQASDWSRPTDFRINFVPEAHFEFELIDVVDSNYGLTAAGADLDNFGSRDERWLLGRDGDWFFITPDGSIFAWDNVPVTEDQPLMGELIARVSTIFHDDPQLFDSIVPADEPLNGFGLIDPTPTLILDAPGATRYEVWISSTTNQTSRTFNVPQDGTFRNLQLFTIDDDNKLPIGEYQYSIRAFDGQRNPTEWSEIRTFRIVTPPEIIRPTIASIETRTTFEWTEVFGASRYELAVDRVAEDGTLTRVIQESGITETSYQVAESLADGTYEFSVRAFNDGVGAVGTSHWSPTATFEVGEDITPEIIGPVGTVNALRPTITWGALDGVARYEIWISESNNSDPLIREGRVLTNSYTTEFALPEGKYFAWVRAISTRGELTDWSEPFVFQTNGGVSEITSPIGTTSDPLPRFTWTPIEDATSYQLFVRQIGNVGSGGAIEFTIPNITETEYTPSAPLNNGTYRVWVRAFNADGERGAWTEGSNFTIVSNDSETDSSTDSLLDEGLLMAALNEFPVEEPVEQAQPTQDPPTQQHDEIVVATSESGDDAPEVDQTDVETVDPVELQIDKVVTEWPTTKWWT